MFLRACGISKSLTPPPKKKKQRVGWFYQELACGGKWGVVSQRV